MKYRVKEYQYMEFDIITEDGGIVSVHHNGEHPVSTYYQDRLESWMEADYVFDQLAEGKAYHKDWTDDTPEEDIIQDALNWLVLPAPTIWEKVDNLFTELI